MNEKLSSASERNTGLVEMLLLQKRDIDVSAPSLHIRRSLKVSQGLRLHAGNA